MFGRKRKRDEENVGLAGLGTGDASQAFAPPTTVNVTAAPAPAPAPPLPGETAPAAPAGIPPIASAGLDPGTMPTNPAAMLGQILSGQGPVGALVAEIRANPEAFRQRMIAQAQAQAHAQAQASGIPNTIQWSATGSGAIQPRHADVIDELTKAADLHHQGALTDEEFAALKKKLLGE